jgi:TonB family protein
MNELKALVSKPGRRLLPSPPEQASQEPKQRRMMVIALALLLAALGIVLYHDRDFWFPVTEEAEDQPAQTTPSTTTAARPNPVAHAEASSPAVASKHHGAALKQKRAESTRPPVSSRHASAPAADSAPPTSVSRTVLPPLEVEVVAGNVHRTVRPGTNSVRVDLQPDSPSQSTAEPLATDTAETAAGVTANAAERVQMSSDTSDVVSRPVTPDYPLLARQMKVQGSVILQALIGRDGLIQDLRVVSGPPILATAAQDAVKQWHFKPHYQGSDAVETQARITVNFTISTN